MLPWFEYTDLQNIIDKMNSTLRLKTLKTSQNKKAAEKVQWNQDFMEHSR